MIDPAAASWGVWLRTLRFTLTFPAAFTIYLPLLLLGIRRLVNGPVPLQFVGVVPIALGFGTYLVCAFAFGQTGRGTPSPYDPPRKLVASGPYRWVRNPMYLGILTALVGEAILFRSYLVLAEATVVLWFFQQRVVPREERVLEQIFGESYATYRATVHRWIPRPPSDRR